MSNPTNRANSVEKMGKSNPEEVRLIIEDTSALMVKMALSAETPKKFVVHMRAVLVVSHIQASERTRPLYNQMMELLDEIVKKAPGDHVVRPPMSVRASKAAFKAKTERYMAEYLEKRKQVLALFDDAKFLQRSEPILAAQEAFSRAQSMRASIPRKLSEDQCKRIAKIYLEETKSGRAGRGTVESLAREFEVSTQTIRNTAKKYKPQN